MKQSKNPCSDAMDIQLILVGAGYKSEIRDDAAYVQVTPIAFYRIDNKLEAIEFVTRNQAFCQES